MVIEKEGKIQIIDFKTGKRSSKEKSYINQLEIYAYLLSEKLGREIESGKIDYLGESGENKITEIKFTKENIEKAIKDFDEIAEKILAENYDCSFDERNEPCISCIFKGYCRNLQR